MTSASIVNVVSHSLVRSAGAFRVLLCVQQGRQRLFRSEIRFLGGKPRWGFLALLLGASNSVLSFRFLVRLKLR